jgi:hypothetical protein
MQLAREDGTVVIDQVLSSQLLRRIGVDAMTQELCKS